MEIKEKFWLFCLIADVLIIVGWFVPFAFIEILPGEVAYYWVWGLASALGETLMLPIVDIILVILVIGILILILVIINAVFCYFFIKKREAKKMFYMVKVVIGVVILILAMAIWALYVPLFPFIGFYLILAGTLIQIVTGIISFRAE